jgi:hypothetical protein
VNFFSLTYNFQDLQLQADELLIKCAPETELVRVDAVAGLKPGGKISPLFTIKAPAPVASASDVTSGNFFATEANLVFHPQKLSALLPEKEKDWPRRVEFKLSLLENGAPVAYRVSVDYIGTGNCFYDANLIWRWSEETQLDLTSERVQDDLAIGTLQLKKANIPRTIVFRIKPVVEPDRTLRFPLANDIKLNNGQHQVGIDKSEDGSFRCAFREVTTAAHYQLKIGRKWLEDSRINSLEIWWEGDFGARKKIGIILPELTSRPLVTDISFEAHPDVEDNDNGYHVPYNGEKQKLGDLLVHVTDPRGEGYELKGRITVKGEQTDFPVDLPTANLPAGLSKLKGGRKCSAFKLKTDGKNEVFAKRPFFKTYAHKIPLEIDTRKVDFSSLSENASFGVHLTLGEGNDIVPYELLVNVAGSSETACQILPKQHLQTEIRSISLNAEPAEPARDLNAFTVANTRTQRGGKYISLRIENIRLKRPDPQSSTNWQLELNGEDGPLAIGEDRATTDIFTLGSKEKLAFTFLLVARGGLSTRVPREDMRLTYDIVHFLHEDARPMSMVSVEAKREERFVDFTVGPVIGRNFISIDLGTSAIVAAHSSSTLGGFDFDFIDLQAQLAEIRRADGKEPTAGEQPEEGTRFLSSNVLLNNNSRVRSESPQNSLVELAPTFLSLFTNHQRWLPNIKMLFGGMRMDRLKKAFKEDLNVINAKGEQERLSMDSPKIIEYSMQALVNSALDHYILPSAKKSFKDKDNLTEMVFTVPNNFPESYRRSIASWVSVDRTAEHPGISVSFVSESDAIAYAYLDQEGQGEQKNLRDGSEIILTYDIGAGTVDLSLVERSINPNRHSESKLEVIGRIGLPKAGNYLDYVIAKIVWEFYGVGSSGDMITIADPFKQPDSSEARAYHQFIRNELKPALSEIGQDAKWGKYIVKPDSKLFSNPDRQAIELAWIIKHPALQEYIGDVTANALSKLFYNAFGENEYKSVNTILFSGRTSQMNVLRSGLLESLDKLPNQDGDRAYIVDVDNWVMGDLQLNQEKLKGIVALGGLRYLKKYRDLDKRRSAKTLRLGERHITSSYGIIYNHSSTSKSDWRYMEMVNPRNDDDIEVEHEEQIDLGGADRLYLIQTYEQDVAMIMKGFNAGHFTGDYTVGLNEGQPIIFSSEDIDPDEIVSVSVSVKEGRSLRFQLIGEHSTSILYHVDFQNYQLGYNTLSPALAESLWPFVDPRKQVNEK